MYYTYIVELEIHKFKNNFLILFYFYDLVLSVNTRFLTKRVSDQEDFH